MEIVTVLFPICQLRKHNRALRKTRKILAEFEAGRIHREVNRGSDTTFKAYAMPSPSSNEDSSRGSGKLSPVVFLDECLEKSPQSLQKYACQKEYNGENIQFLTKVIGFRKHWEDTFSRPGMDVERARMQLFRSGLSIYTGLIHTGTANYPINVESYVKKNLDKIFGKATDIVNTGRRSSANSAMSSPNSDVCPWDIPDTITTPLAEAGPNAIAMQPMLSVPTTPALRKSPSCESTSRSLLIPAVSSIDDPLKDFCIPIEFNVAVFEPAFVSIRYMVWTETWQRYQAYHEKELLNETVPITVYHLSGSPSPV